MLWSVYWIVFRRPPLLPRSFINLLILLAAIPGFAQQQQPQQPQQTGAPLTLTLQDALARARANSVDFQAALTDQAVAHQDKVQARATLLPSVSYNNSAIYTQRAGITTAGTTATPGSAEARRFIAA